MFFNKSNMKEKTIATLLACMENLSKNGHTVHPRFVNAFDRMLNEVLRLQGLDRDLRDLVKAQEAVIDLGELSAPFVDAVLSGRVELDPEKHADLIKLRENVGNAIAETRQKLFEILGRNGNE